MADDDMDDAPKSKKKGKKPFVLTLKSEEAAEVLGLEDGKGPKKLIEYLQAQLENDNLKVTLNASQTGKIIMIMMGPGKGGFKAALKKAFKRPLLARLSSQ